MIQNVNELPNLDELISNGYITKRKHPAAKLFIYNYTARAQYSDDWNEATLTCRGLITDGEGNIVSRPFKKFFNLDQVQTLPDEPFQVFDKLDGCFLGNTKLNLWDGGTIPIRDVVKNKLPVTLIGRDENGQIVPCDVIDWFDNGTKKEWMLITVDCLVSKKSGARCGNNIPITPNHSVWINGVFKPAGEAKVGDMMSTYEDMPDSNALHMIESSLLGDGCVSATLNSFRYQELHTKEHDEYIDYMCTWLGDCFGQKSERTSGYGTTLSRVDSKHMRSLSKLRSKWYPNEKKCVPADLMWMDDFSVAKWYMDDGSLAHNEEQQDRALFSTNGFDRSGVERLAQRLTDMYGVSCTVYESKGMCLRVNAGRNKAIDNMWAAIAPHVVPRMRYKLPEKYRGGPYQEREPGKLVRRLVDARITNIRDLPFDGQYNEYFGAGRVGYDVKTTTGNYFCKGVLVHNSLGISYWYNGKACIASRGSFTGDQAMQGTEMLIAWEEQSGQKLNPQWTYLFEIIYPENQIVCDYGSTRELVLIAVIDTATGQELPLYNNRGWPNFDMPMVGQLEWIKTIDQLKQFVEQLEWVETAEELKRFVPDNDGDKRGSVIEGFVLRYQSGLRVKVKTTEYTRLHRILTGITEKNLLEDYLMTGADLQPLLERVPDEFYGWVKATVADFQGQYDTIERDAKAMLAEYAGQDRRTCGIAFSKMAFAHVLFKMLDGKPYEKMIWKLIRTKTLTTFKRGEG